jgi:transcriptional regulator with XRE-family HTH domain
VGRDTDPNPDVKDAAMPRKRPTPDPAFGVRVRELCTEQHLPLAELARRSGLSPGVLRRIVGATRPVQPAERRSIARALGVKVQELARKKVAVPAAEVAVRRQLEQERDALREQVDALRAELSAERAARSAQHERETHAQADDAEELDALRGQVDTLSRQLAAERAARSAEVAELRERHMRELAHLRTSFYNEQDTALGEAQERAEKLTVALHVALDEVDRLSRAAPRRPAYTGPVSCDPVAPPPAPPAAAAGPNSAFTEKIAPLLAGLGVAFGTWLLTSKRT